MADGGVIRIVVKCDPARTSPNQRLHWAERHRRNDAARAAARAGGSFRRRASKTMTIDPKSLPDFLLRERLVQACTEIGCCLNDY